MGPSSNTSWLTQLTKKRSKYDQLTNSRKIKLKLKVQEHNNSFSLPSMFVCDCLLSKNDLLHKFCLSFAFLLHFTKLTQICNVFILFEFSMSSHLSIFVLSMFVLQRLTAQIIFIHEN